MSLADEVMGSDSSAGGRKRQVTSRCRALTGAKDEWEERRGEGGGGIRHERGGRWLPW